MLETTQKENTMSSLRAVPFGIIEIENLDSMEVTT